MSASLLIGTYILFLIGIIIIFWLIFYYDKQRKRLKTYYQQELLRTKLEIQERTFKSVSQEIHDNIGQMLSLAKLNLNRININQQEEDRIKLNDAKELISKSIKELRNLSKTLNAENIERAGLLKAIEMELQLLQNADGKTIDFKAIGTVVRIDAQKELFLYRIFQEAIHNIVKHAGASFIQVMIIYDEKGITLTISDDGQGFDSTLNKGEGSGLRNMKSRAKLIGASSEISSSRENGTIIHINLPIT